MNTPLSLKLEYGLAAFLIIIVSVLTIAGFDKSTTTGQLLTLLGIVGGAIFGHANAIGTYRNGYTNGHQDTLDNEE